jgi:hypothetical protein
MAALVAGLWAASTAIGQVVINEFIAEVRDSPGSGSLAGDGGREFIELYNPTGAPIDISGYGVRYTNLSDSTQNGYVLPAAQSIPANGYYVIYRTGDAFSLPGGVPFTTVTGVAANAELLPDAASVTNAAGLSIALTLPDFTTVVDAVATEVYNRYLSAGPGVTRAAKQAVLTSNGETSFTGGGYAGNPFSMINSTPVADTNHNANYETYSFSRWRDGVTTNSTGRDFGHLPATPGASNNVTISPMHVVPDVDALTAIHPFVPEYLHAFIGARAIDPGTADAYNPVAIPNSPQGGKVIVAWDQTGGGNAIYSKELVRGFDIDAYFDASALAHPVTDDQEWEHSIYGIGTTDGWMNSPNPLGTIDTTGTPAVVGPATVSANGSTGIGWMYQRHEEVGGLNPTAKLALIYFGDSGESNDPADWDVLEEITLAPGDTGWHRLSISYDETTGDVTAFFGEQMFEHTIDANLYGQFYVGYREGLSTHGGIASPPIFDMRAPAVVDNADFDGDGDKDGADFLIWQRGVGTAGTQAQGNANGVGLIDGADLAIWEAQFGTATVASAPVPEPTSLVLVSLAALGLVAARRRRA